MECTIKDFKMDGQKELKEFIMNELLDNLSSTDLGEIICKSNEIIKERLASCGQTVIEKAKRPVELINGIVNDAYEKLKRTEFNNPCTAAGYYTLYKFQVIVNHEKYDLSTAVSIGRDKDEGKKYYSIYYLVDFDGGDTVGLPDYEYTEHLTKRELKKALKKIYEMVSSPEFHRDIARDVAEYLVIHEQE